LIGRVIGRRIAVLSGSVEFGPALSRLNPEGNRKRFAGTFRECLRERMIAPNTYIGGLGRNLKPDALFLPRCGDGCAFKRHAWHAAARRRMPVRLRLRSRLPESPGSPARDQPINAGVTCVATQTDAARR
jgi:hypothetical protein